MAEQSSSAGEYRFFLDLFIVHPTLVPDEITKILGMEPTSLIVSALPEEPRRARLYPERMLTRDGGAISKPAAEQQASLFNSWTAFSPTNCPAQRLLDLSISICHSGSSATRVFRSRGRLLLDDCFGATTGLMHRNKSQKSARPG
ncbi:MULTISPECIES: hypothetical protein [Bradyrhizobium]|uniref:hypothetical protein n=1 Tax=Bradyrhizobium TaxID=374 RepID=UPI001EDBF373|nr:hypothetical protein [Bradyrhizobium zhengyangense]MCG2645314.1 hypothetical protein [Bradyrhizobium zhengyangense]